MVSLFWAVSSAAGRCGAKLRKKDSLLAKHNYEPGLNGAGRELLVRKAWDSQSRQWDNETWHSQYSTSDIDAWNNGEYKARFSSKVQELMGETTFYCTQGGTTFDNWSGALITLQRAIFILSVTELAGNEYGFNQEGTILPISDVLMNIGNSEWTRSAFLNNPAQAGCRGGIRINAVATTTWLFARQAFTLPVSTLVDENLNLIEE